jgi:hypothetical protein
MSSNHVGVYRVGGTKFEIFRIVLDFLEPSRSKMASFLV